MKILRWLDRKFEESMMILSLILIAVVMFLQVVMRYVLGSSLTWPEEFTRYSFIFMAVFGFSYSIREGSILKIDIILELLPTVIRKIMEVLIHFITLAFFIYVFYNSIHVVISIKNSGQISPALGLPMFYMFGLLSLGFLLSIVRSVQTIIFLKSKGFNDSQDEHTANIEAE